MQTLAELEVDPVVTAFPEESAQAALERLLLAETTEIYVIDADNRLLGIVPDYSLLKAWLNGSWCESTVGQIMSHHVLCFTPQTSAAEAVKSFREGQHSRAALVQEGKLIGQMTRTTLLRSLTSEVRPTLPRPNVLRSELARNATTLRDLAWG
jgi:CBS-domain-containing membrane protein